MREKCDLREDMRILLHPNNVFKEFIHQKYPSLDGIYAAYPQFQISGNVQKREEINGEWARLMDYEFPESTKMELSRSETSDDFWNVLRDYQDPRSHDRASAEISSFAHTVFIIPNSNATSEQAWSERNDLKTKNRNQFGFASIRTILLGAQYVKDHEGILFKPTLDMIKAMRSLKVHKRKSTDEYLNSNDRASTADVYEESSPVLNILFYQPSDTCAGVVNADVSFISEEVFAGIIHRE
ncbi:hypothetical protein QAD02_015801 [Eretmocerus hayati]|uniref:Uncharacterized protein n=1 Tax=Eretmocerus hayati TaxID=131215 RepID=A0ACC2PBQ4_9HYME|nr:hypothetical protein QAD02_015801 [Eretmocerus hayati]